MENHIIPEEHAYDNTSDIQGNNVTKEEYILEENQEKHSGEESDFSALPQIIKHEINLMLRYAMHCGKRIPEETEALLHIGTTHNLIKAHGIICDAIAPATPETITYLNKFYRQKKRFVLFSPIPLVRNFTLISIIGIISLVISSLSPEVNTETLSKGVLNNHGFSLLINLVFLSSASLIGAVFFLLSKLTHEVEEATLSLNDNTYYWTMLIMGVLSGMILSEGVSVQTDVLNGSVETNRLIFAILGGFSSEIVYNILQIIMQKIQAAIASI